MMSKAVKIQSFKVVEPMIYAYDTPGVTYHEGWLKIGYTEDQTPEIRIRQQTHTADIRTDLLWKHIAKYTDNSGCYFRDTDFHSFLEYSKGIERMDGEEKKKEWFHINKSLSNEYFTEFASRGLINDDKSDYFPRDEQADAVRITREYFENGGKEFLWNAKPRFGKTLTSYELIQQMNIQHVLVVTNRPSVANSWADDFAKYIAWRDKYCFVSDTDALKSKLGVMTRDEYVQAMLHAGKNRKGMIAFESLQGLKGSVYFGGIYDKLQWMSEFDFDLLIVDEAQEGVDTIKTERAFKNIKRKYTLYMSGTPFKALASEQFADDQIYNWSYVDEQKAKANWKHDSNNPYEKLPQLHLFTYRLSDMILDKAQRGIILEDEDEPSEYAFDLNEFFSTNESGKFIHEEDVKKFLDHLTTNDKYPFSTPELRANLAHTLWLLDRVASAKALAKLLMEMDVFSDYEIVLAAGDGRLDDIQTNDKSFDRVKDAIANHDKTITISVGQLTVGVTIPEWSGVLMLCNLSSASSYMQAAFRVQNPCSFTKGKDYYRKEKAYIFDFDPARTLIIYDEFANNLYKKTVSGLGTTKDREDNIKQLLNFFPILGEDDEGTMIELDAAKVLSIPRHIKSQEVVRRGFLSNFLFQNISNVFGAPSVVKSIIEKIAPSNEDSISRREAKEPITDVPVNEKGEIEIPTELVIGETQKLFGDKVYKEIRDDLDKHIDSISTNDDYAAIGSQVDEFAKLAKETVKEKIIAKAGDEFGLTQKAQNRIEQQINKDIDSSFDQMKSDFEQQAKIAEIELNKKKAAAETQHEMDEADAEFNNKLAEAKQKLIETIDKSIEKTAQEKPAEVIRQIEHIKAEKQKRNNEDLIRAHLRGFSRTIPSFIMAYGDRGLKLENFEKYTEDDVFLEVTGISEDDFCFLRDGGDFVNEETGQTEHFNGNLFNEVVFNDAISEFLNKKEELANYFDESLSKDIFDYIPPQKTNQIFTPRWIVSKMVDELENNNPGCFDDPNNTFADLYMKSGLYITEIIKRLYNSNGMKKQFPNDKDRIDHIISDQVFGMAPTRIIYLIATNYILGFDNELLKNGKHNFVEADAAEASKNNMLEELVEEHFGNKLKELGK